MKKIKTISIRKAFSLIELSIVLLIISIIITGAMSVSVVAVNNAKYKVTNDRIQEIYKAIGQFLLKNYRLPCPASLLIAKTSAGYGLETIGNASSGYPDTCYTVSNTSFARRITQGSQPGLQQVGTVSYGMVPVATLGLSSDMAEDGFGSKIVYMVMDRLTIAEYPIISNIRGFSYLSESDNYYRSSSIKLLQQPSNDYIDSVVLVIMSHGANKYGAYNSNSIVQNSTSGISPSEQNNISSGLSFNSAYFAGTDSKPVIISSDSSSDVFDDIVFFKRRSDLISDFDAKFLIPCMSTYYNSRSYDSVFYGALQYGSPACVAPVGVKPSYRCGPNGAWMAVDTCTTY